MTKRLLYIIIALYVAFSCNKQQPGSSLDIITSVDTLFFDTVFTRTGTAVRFFKVYNPDNTPIKIDDIYLARGESSPFRLNINGQPVLHAKDVIIPAHDSIYIFSDVCIDPQKNYLIELDSVVFSAGGMQKSVKLLAIGREVRLLRKYIVTTTETWDNTLPYLVFDYVYVDTNAQLNITQGTEIYLHRGAVFYVAGSLKSSGSQSSPVIFSSDRLEPDYDNVPGQWGGIVLSRTSRENRFDYTQIKNSIVGISADSVADTVKIHNSAICHQSFASVYAYKTNLQIYGSLLADAGWYVFALSAGGSIDMINNTIANYYGWGTIRNTPSVAITNYKIINNTAVYQQPANVKIHNTIIYGSLENELILSAAEPWNDFSIDMGNNLIKTNGDYPCDSCIINKDPLFNGITDFDFTLTVNSPAINRGSPVYITAHPLILETDLLGNNRLSDGQPDIGAFEYTQAQ